jgi:hypothetical protein
MIHDVTPFPGIRIPAIAGILAADAICDVPDVSIADVSSAVADNFSVVGVHGVFVVACNPNCCRCPCFCWRPCCFGHSVATGCTPPPLFLAYLAVAGVSAIACVPALANLIK